MKKSIAAVAKSGDNIDPVMHSFQERTLTLADGEQIHIHEIGEGAPLFILHGWSGTHDRNRPMMAELAKKYRVIAWDARGHGTHTYRNTTPVTLDQLAEDLNEVLDAMGLNQVNLIGHSMGAALAWKYMTKYGQDRVDRLVVIDMTPKLGTDDDWRYGVHYDFPPESQAAFVEAMQQDMPEAVLRIGANGKNELTRRLYEADDPQVQAHRKFLQSIDRRAVIELWKSLVEQDFRVFLTGLRMPTLLIFGGQSQYYGKELADWMHATVPGSTLHFMPKGDHSPQIMFPLEVAQVISDFLESAVRK